MIEGKDYKIENGHLIIFDGVKRIEKSAFRQMSIKCVSIPNSVIHIGEFAFRGSNLINLVIPNSVISIGKFAFRRNKLKSIEISNSVRSIGEYAFHANKLTHVEIPNSVKSIGFGAFDNIDITYGGVLINKDMIKKYGCENVIKIYKFQKMMPLNQVYNIPKFILDAIPATEDAIKGYILNRKVFENLNTFDESEEEYKDFFKMCFVLGLFSKPDEQIIAFIKKVKEKTSEYNIHQMWTAVNLTTYKPKFKDLFIKLYNEGKTEYNDQNIIGRLYSAFEKISKYTLKRHEDIISKKNTEIKRLKELGANTIYLEDELATLKKNKKNIEYEDIVYYIKNNAFDIREGNEALKDIEAILSIHMEQDDFDKIQDLYEESIDVEKSIPLTKDKSESDIKYHWSKSDNPVNIILGYLVDCCAKLGGAGEDIMRQSMVNPDIANLIIYDENNQAIGKATAYYNRKKKYILFNNAETKVITSKGLKSEKQRQKECLEALIRGAMDAVNALKEKGQDIKEVRVGMLRNDLEDAITEYGLKISHNLSDSYNWQGYSGDASDTAKGQAIIYRDDNLLMKGSDIKHD